MEVVYSDFLIKQRFVSVVLCIPVVKLLILFGLRANQRITFQTSEATPVAGCQCVIWKV